MPEAPVLETQPAARRLLDVKQVAAMLNCSWRTILRHADAGTFPPGHKIGTPRRWNVSDVDTFITNGCKMPSDSSSPSSEGKRR